MMESNRSRHRVPIDPMIAARLRMSQIEKGLAQNHVAELIHGNHCVISRYDNMHRAVKLEHEVLFDQYFGWSRQGGTGA
ncbi:MAG TPA: hypothetical protein VGK19_22440 [Capsulimonadaceae bacterium]|jgi:hypothetical protein